MVTSAAAVPLTAEGTRVRVAPVAKADLAPYRRAVEASRSRLAQWNPVDPDDLDRHLRFQSSGHRTFIVHALAPFGEHDIVGRINVTNVVRGRFLSGSVGYDSYDPYAGSGLFGEGLALVVGLAFAPEPHGMGLHRLEASVQPGNVRSAGLLRRIGFRRGADWPAYLWLPDAQGCLAWRDSVTYALTVEEWPTSPYTVPRRDRPLVVLQILDGAVGGAGRVGPFLAAELGVGLIGASIVATLDDAALVDLLACAPGAVVEASPGRDLTDVLRHAGYADDAVVRVRPEELSRLVSARDVCALALHARALAHRG